MTDPAVEREPAPQDFTPICAIGASAGGVGALQTLFRLLPDDLGIAYVVILHLSPEHPSAMHEILRTCTKMPVHQVWDGPRLTANCVYIIPPDRELVIFGDEVTARPFSEPRGRRAPIDLFFRSIAGARGDGMAVVLTGAGADGALGVRAIKEAGGVVLAQDPAEAEFPTMPQNAIATGAVDFVAPLARLAERITEVAHSKEAVRSLDEDGAANDLRRIVAFLRTRTGHDFSSYKRATVLRRVLRRVQVCRLTSLAEYATYLRETPEEAKELLGDLLISVTMFFRDPAAFEALSGTVARSLLEGKEEELRVWVVGCATGEEAYSVAILLLEEADRLKVQIPFQIFATDLDEGALMTAREGRYPKSIATDVSAERLERFFVDDGGHYRIRQEVRDLVLFALHSVVREPPFLRLDLITCRNMLIYLERALQQQVCTVFHYALKPDRYLFLGSAETADTAQGLFAPIDREARIYQARPQASPVLPFMSSLSPLGQLPSQPSKTAITRQDAGEFLAAGHTAALEDSSPPSVLVEADHTILHVSPTAGRFLITPGGPLSTKLSSLARPELRLELGMALDRAIEGKVANVTRSVIVPLEGESRSVSLYVAPATSPAGSPPRALVWFLDQGMNEPGDDGAPARDTTPDELRRLHEQLRVAQERANAVRADHSSVVQELTAANEELQSLNEEYRSTAEELETSKEELQSLNEELQTVNAELKSKLSTISSAHNDLQNLTDSSEIGTLFLDTGLRIRMFTPPVTDLFNITDGDVGRPITNFTHHLNYEEVEQDVRVVLRDLAPIEKEICSASDRWFMVRVRPYRTLDNRVDGVVVTFDDITERRQIARSLRENEEQLAAIFETALDYAIFTTDFSGTITRWSPGAAAIFGWSELEIVGQSAEMLFVPEDRSAGQMEREMRAARENGAEEDVRWHLRKDGSRVYIQGAVRSLGSWGFAKIGQDVTERRAADTALRESEALLRQFGEASQDILWIREVDTLQWRYLTPAFEATYGLPRAEALEGDNYRSWLELVLPDDREHAAKSIARVAAGEQVTFEYRVRRPADGHVRWLRDVDFPILNDTGEVVQIGGVGHDVTSLKLAEAALASAERWQRALIEGVPQLVWRAGERGLWTWASPQWTEFTGQAEEDSHGRGWLKTLHPDDRERVETEWEGAEERGEFQAEYRLHHAAEDAWRWVQTRATPLRDEKGAIVEWLGTSTDIDDLRRSRERQQVLLAELQHRVRNIMAMIRAIVGRTAETSDSVETFASHLTGRLNSMARTQVLLTRSVEAGVDLENMILNELKAQGASDNRFTVEGSEVRLSAKAAEVLTLAIHELATNAIKYGALGASTGQVKVRWVVDTDDPTPWLRLTWIETGVQIAITAPRREGFGTELIKTRVPYELKGRGEHHIQPGGITCTIQFPLKPGESILQTNADSVRPLEGRAEL